MEKTIFNRTAKILRDYPRLEAYIAQREYELMHPYNPKPDENVGGGKAQFKKDDSTELMALTIAEDKQLRSLKREFQVITDCLERSDDVTKEIIHQLYFKEFPDLTVVGVAEHCHIDRSKVSQRRTQFFEMVASELGMVSL